MGIKTWLPTVTFFLLACTGLAGTYFVQQQRIDSLSDTITTLRRDIDTLKKDASASLDDTSDTSKQSESTTYTSEKGVKIIVTAPRANATISSPLAVSGKVPGSWSFEASFSIKLIDAAGERIAESPATLQGDWMTNQLVPFSSTLSFDTATTKNATLVLLRSNPSDLPENNDTLAIPVRFNTP